MKRLRVYLTILVLASIFVGSLQMIGCSESYPGELLGTWKEVDYGRKITFHEDGDFFFMEYHQVPTPKMSGISRGIWSVSGSNLKIEPESRMCWLEYRARAPVILTWKYVISGDTLTLTGGLGGESVVYKRV
jgi:hypothetical protein